MEGGSIRYPEVAGALKSRNIRQMVRFFGPAAIIGGVLTCGLWCLAMVWTDGNFLPRPYQMGKALVVLNMVFVIAMTSFGLKALIDRLVKTF